MNTFSYVYCPLDIPFCEVSVQVSLLPIFYGRFCHLLLDLENNIIEPFFRYTHCKYLLPAGSCMCILMMSFDEDKFVILTESNFYFPIGLVFLSMCVFLRNFSHHSVLKIFFNVFLQKLCFIAIKFYIWDWFLCIVLARWSTLFIFTGTANYFKSVFFKISSFPNCKAIS